MDCRVNSDLFLLTDEKFDFDVSLSPASSRGDEDEDEVFVGPVTHKERCVSVHMASQLEDGGDVQASWTPLSGDQLEAVCQEAHRLADQLRCGDLSQSRSEDDNTSTSNMATDATSHSEDDNNNMATDATSHDEDDNNNMATDATSHDEDDNNNMATDATSHDEDDNNNMATDATSHQDDFVQDAAAKLCLLDKTPSLLTPVKRQTFVVQDSPMKTLPPVFQRRLLRGSSASTTSSTSTSTSTRPATRQSTASPVAGVKPQPRTGLRGKTALAVVLPNKPAAATTTTTSCSANKSRVDKTRLQPPSKAVGGWKRSPSSRPSSRPASRAGSSEDLLSDSASVASDVSDSSLNSSLLGKRSLAPPTKRNLSGVKAPPLQRRVTERKNTSSSSSSVSSFNSSISSSPAKGKLNSSLNRSTSTGPAPSSSIISRPASQSRLRRSSVYAAAEPTSSSAAAARRSVSTSQTRKLSEVAKAARSTPLKRAETTPIQGTPAKRTASIGAAGSASTRPLQSGLKTRSKPEAVVLPTAVSRPADLSKMVKPRRLTSVSSLDSLPQKASAAPMTPSTGRTLPMRTRRPSALPTPVRLRASALPLATPTRPPPTPGPAPTSAKMERSCSSAPEDPQEEEEEPVEAPAIQPFSLEEEEEAEPPVDPPTCTVEPDQSQSSDAGAPSEGQSEPSENLIELETTEESNAKTQEVLLLDLPAPTLHPHEKLLIDLTNTPDLIRNSSKTCTANQLIDLSSPLIKWSPDEKHEHNAPLINLSF